MQDMSYMSYMRGMELVVLLRLQSFICGAKQGQWFCCARVLCCAHSPEKPPRDKSSPAGNRGTVPHISDSGV